MPFSGKGFVLFIIFADLCMFASLVLSDNVKSSPFSRRLKEAASHKAEADKVRQVKAAEADAEARYLSGLGVARQRKAIVQGLQESVGAFATDVKGATPKDVMDILLLSQYFDTLSAVVSKRNMYLCHIPVPKIPCFDTILHLISCFSHLRAPTL